jgi:ferredoxin-like protein FixX
VPEATAEQRKQDKSVKQKSVEPDLIERIEQVYDIKLNHLRNCPATRQETYVTTNRDGVRVRVLRCIECADHVAFEANKEDQIDG